jgi:urease accessory protein
MSTTMTERAGGASLLRLMTWLSPAFPVGGFSYSHGLERAVHDRLVTDAASLEEWLAQLIELGSGWNDALLFSESSRRAASGEDLAEVKELAEALAGSRERHRETMLQGEAFLKAAAAWRPDPVALPANSPYCVVVGAVSGASGIALGDALGAFVQAFTSNLVQVAMRLGIVGQTDAMGIVARLEPKVLAVTARAADASLDDLGSAALMSEVVAMKHETQHSRLFRT